MAISEWTVAAYLTHSILPGLVVHVIGLMIFLTLVWPYKANQRLVAEGGADAGFWIHVAMAIIFAALAFLAFRRLARLNRKLAKSASDRRSGFVKTRRSVKDP